MNRIAEKFYAAMDNQLAEVTLSGQSPTEQYRTSIMICKKAMTKMKRFVSHYAFENVAEEIHFFKDVKPLFYSKYIYFINVYNFLMQYPAGGEEAVKTYINFHMADLQRFFDNNKAFYQYYRSGGTQMDEVYFTRGGFDVQMELEDFEEDEQYSTSHDYKLSKIMANEKVQDYLNLELARIDNGELIQLNNQKIFPFNHPNWTASQTDAVELLYSLKASGAVNHGNIDISELVGVFEFVFQTELHETYHKLLDITRRKKDMFIFLNRLMNSFASFIYEKFN
ncbi:RteC domain-containing protein [Mucilaginibacter sp. ZT4R22]|uniref:RteC domain-containing protein n=1 Tax=Mucilaginibacter pankratovii TaxID=2772110 RepID=A0ABR7WKW4_9SPHI|nr:RteC domain-containing protein [Mucilaginibacter pankratovii]MBD1362968.1 RteC domain-containing protein [Mucilaginibacter pankratovii]